MKRTDLVKSLGLKIRGQMQQAGTPGRFAQGSAALPDRREQRKMDQAAGLVPFAVKLHKDLVGQLREMAERDGIDLNALTDQLIRAGMGAAPSAAQASKVATPKAPVTKAPAKKAAAKQGGPAKAVEEVKLAPAKKVVAKKAPAKKAASKSVKPKA